MEKIKITKDFKSELESLKCQTSDDFITITRKEDGKAYFTYGVCKLHIPLDEIEEITELQD